MLEQLVQHDNQHHRKVLLCRCHLDSHTSDFNLRILNIYFLAPAAKCATSQRSMTRRLSSVRSHRRFKTFSIGVKLKNFTSTTNNQSVAWKQSCGCTSLISKALICTYPGVYSAFVGCGAKSIASFSNDGNYCNASLWRRVNAPTVWLSNYPIKWQLCSLEEYQILQICVLHKIA